jgi:hypothetical protein
MHLMYNCSDTLTTAGDARGDQEEAVRSWSMVNSPGFAEPSNKKRSIQV